MRSAVSSLCVLVSFSRLPASFPAEVSDAGLLDDGAEPPLKLLFFSGNDDAEAAVEEMRAHLTKSKVEAHVIRAQ